LTLRTPPYPRLLLLLILSLVRLHHLHVVQGSTAGRPWYLINTRTLH
jgi:hypothetical protein